MTQCKASRLTVPKNKVSESAGALSSALNSALQPTSERGIGNESMISHTAAGDKAKIFS